MKELSRLIGSKNVNSSSDDKDLFKLIETLKSGIKFTVFKTIAGESPFSLAEWCHFLHLSERTMQRYTQEKKTFEPLQSEKILQIALLYKKGTEVFGSKEHFNFWLKTENISLGNLTPVSLLDNSFGIDMIKAELHRIENGVLA
jgi:putative toxin-antitoxin system antitoxin component (TIGR02293 family)